MQLLLVVVVVLGCARAYVADKLTFYNYSVYSLIPMNTQSLNILKNWEEFRSNDFNFWSSVTTVNRSVDVMVPPHLKSFVERIASTMGMSSKVFIENVQEHIDRESSGMLKSEAFGWTQYHTLEEINDWIRELSRKYPQNVALMNVGETYEKRQILGLKVTFKPVPQKTVFIEANIHAREWITSAVATYILNELLTSTNDTVRQIAESHDWYFIPVANPDGLAFTQTSNRMWRKTRTPYGLCRGADPNRNWGYRWNTGGSSNAPCSDVYHGPRPFSEPSTLAIAEFISKVAETEDLVAYISFHSYSQMFLIPYGHTTDHLDNYKQMLEVGLKARDSLARRYGTNYVVGNTAEVIYVATGSSADWVKGNFKIPIVYTYELRDKGEHGFLLPPELIIPTGEETLDSLITILVEGEQYIRSWKNHLQNLKK